MHVSDGQRKWWASSPGSWWGLSERKWNDMWILERWHWWIHIQWTCWGKGKPAWAVLGLSGVPAWHIGITIMKFIPEEKCQKCCMSVTVPGHTQVCWSLRQSRNLDGLCYKACRAVLLLHLLVVSCLVLWNADCDCIVMVIMRHCRTLHVNDFRGRRGSFSVLECILVLEGGLLMAVGTVLRHNHAFSNVVVRFCAIFTCLACQ